ncbi:MAG: sigma 54-interacting transcriptional regulator [Desulfobacterales bacterium]|nr:sigma 54-interacting transcriptional regulator [Desulfobacterales bacterium]MDX2509472.1 sigma 54-interacting transcriptional regulator [Desulfobacterales bacterium]
MNKIQSSIEKNCHIIFDSIEEGVFTVDLDWCITSFNRAAEKITGIPREKAVGRPCLEIFCTNICKTDCVLRKVLDTNKPVTNMPVYIIRSDAKRIPISVNATILRDRKGHIIGGVETFRDLSDLSKLHKSFQKHYSFGNIISKNKKMLEIFSTLFLISESDCTVLIEGATGTGKELLARAVHNNSPQKNGPFIPVNCGALPNTLIESELFGYKAGAFTDAKTDKPGRFELAQNGTIFLDEIGDIPRSFQNRLLRVLEENAYEPLGSIKSTKTNARIVAATNRELDKLVEKNKFREDLYFRINVMKLTLPELAKRKEDIPLLVDHFIQRFNCEKKKNILGVTQEAIAALVLYDWPGNIRELENAIEHAFVLCREELISLKHLPDEILSKINATFAATGTTLKEIEKNAIFLALQRNNWKRAVTAKELEINKNTLRRKIIRYGIEMK